MGDELALYVVIRNRHDWDKPDVYLAQSAEQVRKHVREANQMNQLTTVYQGTVDVSEQFGADGGYGGYELKDLPEESVYHSPLPEVKPIDDDPLVLLTRLLSLMRFAVENAHSFTRDDPDGVKGVWMDMAREAIEALDKKGKK